MDVLLQQFGFWCSASSTPNEGWKLEHMFIVIACISSGDMKSLVRVRILEAFTVIRGVLTIPNYPLGLQ
jgi:hypothetical protein